MAEEIPPVFQLRQKIAALTDWAKQNHKCDLQSVRAIARSTGIDRDTLVSNIRVEKMAVPNQEALAKAYGFKISWREWHDRNATRTTPADQRRDTAEAFRQRLFALAPVGERLTIKSGVAVKYIDHRFTSFAFAVPGSFKASSDSDGIP